MTDTERIDAIERAMEGTGKALSLAGTCYWSVMIGRAVSR
jgi:hypothetical protein